MIADLDQSPGGEIRCDLCIIGAGIAGVALALALKDEKLDVCVLESGGTKYEDSTQALSRGRIVGVPYFALDACRIRQLGGTSAHWGGACWPLEPVDFEKKDWLPGSGWPVAFGDIEPYFRKAHDFFQLGDYNYVQAGAGPAPGKDTGAKTPLDLDYRYLRPKFYKTARVMRFGRLLDGEASKPGGLRLYLHANVTALNMGAASGAIESATVRTLSGKTTTVYAKQFVLAAGGIEIPRLLLASNDRQGAGIGNQHDLVGRYFMDHLFLPATCSMLFESNRDLGYFRTHVASDQVQARGGLGLKTELLAGKRLLNTWFGLEIFGTPPVPRVSGMRERSAWNPETLKQTTDEMQAYLSALRQQSGASGGDKAKPAPFVVQATCVSEQAPNPNSRVTLSGDKDALGVPLPALDWQLSADDYRSVIAVHKLLASELGAASTGRLLLNLDPDEAAWSSVEKISTSGGVYGSYHHMGTTRMAHDPRHGVVDRDCIVFGTTNLYVASSSVFPTVGYANPTLTIVALALRLADRIKATSARS